MVDILTESTFFNHCNNISNIYTGYMVVNKILNFYLRDLTMINTLQAVHEETVRYCAFCGAISESPTSFVCSLHAAQATLVLLLCFSCVICFRAGGVRRNIAISVHRIEKRRFR